MLETRARPPVRVRSLSKVRLQRNPLGSAYPWRRKLTEANLCESVCLLLQVEEEKIRVAEDRLYARLAARCRETTAPGDRSKREQPLPVV